MLYLDIPDFKLLITAIRTAAEQAQEDINLTTGNITSGTCQKLAGGEGGGNFKFGFRNEVTHPCNGRAGNLGRPNVWDR